MTKQLLSGILCSLLQSHAWKMNTSRPRVRHDAICAENSSKINMNDEAFGCHDSTYAQNISIKIQVHHYAHQCAVIDCLRNLLPESTL